MNDEEKVIPRTTLGFNPEQAKHFNTVHKSHPEHPDRIEYILRSLQLEPSLLEDCNVIRSWLRIDEGDLRQSHDLEYVTRILQTNQQTDQEALNKLSSEYDSVFLTQASSKAAGEAVACCRTLSEMIINDQIPNGFAIVRPPGHHAEPASAGGFCIFNNVAQAAESAYNFGTDRILIVDLDVHHGNGTQKMFYDDKRVLYVSVHRYEHGNYWPHLPESNYDHIGSGEGKGYNINIPLNQTGCTDSDYLSIFWNVIWPLAVDFLPDIVIVSAGFDSCDGDPLGQMKLTPIAYSHIIYHLKALAKGKLLLVLEGGYNHSVTAVGVRECSEVLMGYSPKKLPNLEPVKQSTIDTCLSVISSVRTHWSCFDFYKVRSGSKSLPWESFDPSGAFNKRDEVESDTADVIQSDLPKIESKIRSDYNRVTYLFHTANDELHFDCADVDHPEKPERTKKIMEQLEADGILKDCQVILSERKATDAELELVHDRPYIQQMRKTNKMPDEDLRRKERSLDSIFLTNDTFDVATNAVGAVLEAVDAVLLDGNSASNAFVVVRPPGHHAGISKPSGFCIFNNVAVASQYAITKHSLHKVLILDWDVHHGNGTQEIFYEDDRVLYMSIHRHEGGMFYPMGELKDLSDVGEGRGEGFSVNIPWSGARMGDLEYITAFSKIIMPIAYEFNPDLVFISAGFDAAKGDPLGEYAVSPETFGFLTHQLMSLAGGRVISVLEGGYNVNSIAQCTSSVCRTLIDRCHKGTISHLLDDGKRHLHPDAWTVLRRSAQVQQRYWNQIKGYQLPDDWHEEVMRDEFDQGCSSSSSSRPVDDSESNFGALHAVVPLTSCAHLQQVKPVPNNGISHLTECASCGIGAEVWICLVCYEGHCGRHVNEHALFHHISSSHPMALSLADISVWCYVCDAYVHNDALYAAKNSAYTSKFGEILPGAPQVQ